MVKGTMCFFMRKCVSEHLQCNYKLTHGETGRISTNFQANP